MAELMSKGKGIAPNQHLNRLCYLALQLDGRTCPLPCNFLPDKLTIKQLLMLRYLPSAGRGFHVWEAWCVTTKFIAPSVYSLPVGRFCII